MLEPAGDLGLKLEPRSVRRVEGKLHLDFFESNLSVQLGIAGDEDFTQSPSGMWPDDVKPRTG